MNISNLIRHCLTALLASFFLLACSSTESFIRTQSGNSWQLKGKIALVYPAANCGGQDCRSRSDQGSITWEQNKQNYTIGLNDPFGRVLMTIAGDSKYLTANFPNQETIEATPNEFIAILASNTQNKSLQSLSPIWLRYWVTGRPAPDSDFEQKNNEKFTQAGYTISPNQWRNTSVGKMPSLITITKDKFKLRLVVKQWQPL